MCGVNPARRLAPLQAVYPAHSGLAPLRIFPRKVACESAHFRAENEVGQRNQNSGQNQRLHAQWQGVGQAGKQDQQARHERPYDQPNQQKMEEDGFHEPAFAEDMARFRIEK